MLLDTTQRTVATEELACYSYSHVSYCYVLPVDLFLYIQRSKITGTTKVIKNYIDARQSLA